MKGHWRHIVREASMLGANPNLHINGWIAQLVEQEIRMIKKCLICNKEFETLPSGGARKYCFECSPSYQKGDNKGRAVAITCIRQAIKRQLVKYKGGKCEKCGYDNSIWAMQFHHKNPENKDFELSNKYNNGVTDMQKLYEEVAKCNLLCANCHAEEHEKDFLNK